MSLKEIDYQYEALFGCTEEAQDGLIKITNKYLAAKKREQDFPEVILKAITGAGKTIIMAQYINEILSQEERPDIVFVWLSIGASGLQFQSAEKITPLLISKVSKVICPKNEQDFNETFFSDGNLLVLNWEKINNTDKNELVSNLMIGEKHNLKKAVANTKDNVRFIVLVDEFHLNYRTEAYNLIMKLFKPSMILGMTATPKSEQLANKMDMHTIYTTKVREAGMIKKGTFFNQDVDQIDLKSNNIGLNEALINIAIKKRESLEADYRRENSDVIPLCLIQVPNNDKEFLNQIINHLSSQHDNGQSLIENKDFVCWMSDISKNEEISSLIKNIDSNNVKYLIFKQSIATGWDCPRAHILVKFRPLKSSIEPFDLQTIGRILRMPERYHYINDNLNFGYIYSPENKFNYDKQVEEALGNIESKNKTLIYTDDVSILETYLKNERLKEIPLDTTQVKSIFCDILEQNFYTAKQNNDYFKVHIFNTSINSDDSLISNFNKDDVDCNDIPLELSVVQLDRQFNSLLKKLERSFMSKNNIKNWIFSFFANKFNIDLNSETGIVDAIKYSLMYESTIKKTALETSTTVHQKTLRLKDDSIPFEFLRSPKYFVEKVDTSYNKCLYSPCTNDNFSTIEKIFIKKLEENPNVKWWYKNPDKGSNALCVVYVEHEIRTRGKVEQILAPTYPDFIVFFENKDTSKKSVGIYETKDADKVEDVNDKKHIAIKDYVATINNNIKEDNSVLNEVFGGVVKVKDFESFDYNGKVLGEISNLSSYPELQ